MPPGASRPGEVLMTGVEVGTGPDAVGVWSAIGLWPIHRALGLRELVG